LQQVTPGSIAWAAVIVSHFDDIGSFYYSYTTATQVIFLLSPDTEFPGSGVGKSSTINYKDLFFQYKKLLITKWETK
jgi:hypothetical protein